MEDAMDGRKDVTGAQGGAAAVTPTSEPEAQDAAPPPETIELTAYDLRALAEAVDGFRGTRFKFVRGDRGRRPAKPARADGAGDPVIIEAAAPSKIKPDKKKTGKLKVLLPQRPAFDNGRAASSSDDYSDVCDALFWSEAAIDKFVAPYYIHMMSLEQLGALVSRYYDEPDTIAFAHLPDSEPVGATVDGRVIPGLFVVKATATGATLKPMLLPP